ncbi:hypothetical protein [Paracidovorax citrulli]
MPPVLKTRLVWLLLVLTLLQAWGAVQHVHVSEALAPSATASSLTAWSLTAGRPEAARVASGTQQQPGESEQHGEADCHCLWCAPRLHAVVAYTLPVPEPPPAARVAQIPRAAPILLALAAPRGTVPPPRGPPA